MDNLPGINIEITCMSENSHEKVNIELVNFKIDTMQKSIEELKDKVQSLDDKIGELSKENTALSTSAKRTQTMFWSIITAIVIGVVGWLGTLLTK